MGYCGVYVGERVTMLRGFYCSIAIALSLLIATAGGDEILVETFHATIEAREGQRLRVVFAAEDRPALIFRPEAGAWDWSRTSRLVIPVENPGDEALTLLMQVEDHVSRSLTGEVAIAPRTAGNLAISIGAPPPRSMGMIAGPSLAPAGLEPSTLPVTATDGAIDASKVTLVRLGMPRPSTPQTLLVEPPRVESDRTSYDGIVDGFGQFLPGKWPEKVSSAEMLRAKGAEEARIVAQWLAERPRRDRFGGLPEVGGFRATGFFRTEQRDGRWWLVTPEGNGFFSIGMDVIALAGETYIDGREPMFRDLPAPDGELAAHWSEHDDRGGLWPQPGRAFDHGRAFNFYTANLERKFGPDWRERWREETVQRLEAWGFNTIGNWSEPDLWAMHRLPYTVPLWLEGEFWWGGMPDPFDPRFAVAADTTARNAAAQFGGDPWLIGYFVDNELSWRRGSSTDPREYYALAINTLARGPDSPAKSIFAAQLIETYREPERLAQAWGISLASWDGLRSEGFALPPANLDNPAVIRDLTAFTRRFAEAYFRTVAEALRRHDPDHLYLGSRFAWRTPEAVEACAQWCDVVSFNLYKRSIVDDHDEWARFHQLGKPAMIGEFHFGSTDRGLFWEGIVGAGRESERGPAFARYLRAVADNPDFVGAHWFQYIDEPLTGRTLDGENAHIGFVTVADLPYVDLAAAARDANLSVLRELQRIASRGTSE
jgi:hypothetical protein